MTNEQIEHLKKCIDKYKDGQMGAVLIMDESGETQIATTPYTNVKLTFVASVFWWWTQSIVMKNARVEDVK